MAPEEFLDEWRLDVLMRPVNAVNALIAAIAPRMTEHLAGKGR